MGMVGWRVASGRAMVSGGVACREWLRGRDGQTGNSQRPAPVVVARPLTLGCCLVPRHPCAGDQFALLEAVTAAAMIVRRFDFERAPDKPPGAGVWQACWCSTAVPGPVQLVAARCTCFCMDRLPTLLLCSLPPPAVGMTTGATIHTTNGLWLVLKPRQQQPKPQPAVAAAAVPLVEQRELALAFSDPAAPLQQQQGTGKPQ